MGLIAGLLTCPMLLELLFKIPEELHEEHKLFVQAKERLENDGELSGPTNHDNHAGDASSMVRSPFVANIKHGDRGLRECCYHALCCSAAGANILPV